MFSFGFDQAEQQSVPLEIGQIWRNNHTRELVKIIYNCLIVSCSIKLICNRDADISIHNSSLVEPPVGVEDDDVSRVEDSLGRSSWITEAKQCPPHLQLSLSAGPPALWRRCQTPPLLSSYLSLPGWKSNLVNMAGSSIARSSDEKPGLGPKKSGWMEEVRAWEVFCELLLCFWVTVRPANIPQQSDTMRLES